MPLFDSIKNLLREPPPAFAFELSEAGIAAARPGAAAADFRPLKAGTIKVSPVEDNILSAEEVAAAVRELAPPAPKAKRREAVLILPDHAARVAVLDFDEFPPDAKEQASLVRFRLKKTVPFDIDEAAVSYHAQPPAKGAKRRDVIAAVAPLEIVARYESPFRASGLAPGLVTTSAIQMLHLVDEPGALLIAKRSGHVLSLLAVVDRGLKLMRCLELSEGTLDEIAQEVFPTLVFMEDNLGARATKLLLCGFGADTREARTRFHDDLGIAVEPVQSPYGMPAEFNAGLFGYLRSLAVH